MSIQITGAFHIGAHDCEELDFYKYLGLQNTDVIWIDAIERKVKEATARGIPNVYTAVITDKDDDTVTFNVSNNVQSSSVLKFKTHADMYPGVVFVDSFECKTSTIDTFFEKNKIEAAKYNFWNFDIQGAELLALKGATKVLSLAKALYLEVNEKELYEGCGLIGEIDSFVATYGFRRVLTGMSGFGWGDALYVKF
jgi:FkbM family methyltransferase